MSSEALLKRQEKLNKENAAKEKAKEKAAAEKRIARQLAKIDAAEKAAAKEIDTIYCGEAGCVYIVNNLNCCPLHPMGKITRTKPIMVVTVRHVLTEDEAQEIIYNRNAKLIKTVRCNQCLLVNCNCKQELPPSKLPSGKLKKKVSFA